MRFQILAGIILLVFYGCYFGKMLMQRRQGIQTDQMGKGKSGGTKKIELTMKVATLSVPIAEVLTMKDSWRAGVSETDKTELVTDGIYQISRNPAFLGFDLVYIGILLLFFNWILVLFSVFAMVMFHLQIVKVEEKFLVSVFGEDYAQYKKTVNRYLGRKIHR